MKIKSCLGLRLGLWNWEIGNSDECIGLCSDWSISQHHPTARLRIPNVVDFNILAVSVVKSIFY